MDTKEVIQKAAELIKEADALLITAGAGIGVDSGLPDFRGNEGFWKAYPPIAELGLSFSDMANPQWFKVDPRLAWAFYGHRLNLYRETDPHDGFSKILDIAKNKKLGYFVFTSNVDGQFQKAGFDPQRICEVHGSIHHLQCNIPCVNDVWPAGSAIVSVDMKEFKAELPLPRCKHCGEIARPNILMFGDYTWLSDRSDEQGVRLKSWMKDIVGQGGRIAVVELGAGKAISTVRGFSESVCRNLEGSLIRINPREHHIDVEGVGIPLGSLEAVRRVAELL